MDVERRLADVHHGVHATGDLEDIGDGDLRRQGYLQLLHLAGRNCRRAEYDGAAGDDAVIQTEFARLIETLTRG